MLSMSQSGLILTYVVAMLAALTTVAIYAELRRRRFEPTPSEDRIFRCRKCGYVYTDDQDVDRSRCAQCGQMNEAIEF
jgi:predicted Zn-ribbon and HTH transcriptional regulator